jgi:hypothetical protein
MPSADKAGQSRADPAGVGIHARPRLHQSARLSAQFWIIRAPIRVNGGSRPPFLLDRPHSSDLERAVAEAAAHPTLASPRRIRDVRGEATYHGDEAAAGGGIGGADDEPEGQAPCGTRGWAVMVVLLVLAWAAGWSEPPAGACGADAIARR